MSTCIRKDRRKQNQAYDCEDRRRNGTAFCPCGCGSDTTCLHLAVKRSAGRDEIKPDYTLIPTVAMRREAICWGKGAKHYGRGNYKAGFTDPAWLRDSFNHAMDHLLKFRDGDKTEDHLAAVRWFAGMAMQAENMGIVWSTLLAAPASDN
jgi:hypothetical protein